MILPVALAVVLALLYGALGSGRGAAAVLCVVPFAATGGLFGLVVAGIPLSVSAAVGFIASETDDELTVKAPGNIVTRYRKADVTARARLPGSLMPPGLLAATNAQDVADLLAFLSGLKKSPSAPTPIRP